MEKKPVGRFEAWKPAIIGGLIALGLLSLILAFFGDPNMAQKDGFLFPFFSVPIAGGIGGVAYRFINSLEFESYQLSIFANFFSVLLYLFLVLIAFSLVVEV